jgi:hypothetical protein
MNLYPRHRHRQRQSRRVCAKVAKKDDDALVHLATAIDLAQLFATERFHKSIHLLLDANELSVHLPHLDERSRRTPAQVGGESLGEDRERREFCPSLLYNIPNKRDNELF